MAVNLTTGNTALIPSPFLTCCVSNTKITNVILDESSPLSFIEINFMIFWPELLNSFDHLRI